MSDERSMAVQRSDERLVLHPEVRRVLGVLLEKSLATPDYYPMTLKALVAGCNQKNNRHPVSHYTEDDVRDALSALQAEGLVLAVKDSGSRATRWRHELQRQYNLQARHAAVVAELLLRGPQTEGELRTRASRMKVIDDMDTLHEVLANLRDRTPPFALRLSPEGMVRGVRHAHALYPDEELERLKVEAEEQRVPLEAAPSAPTRAAAEIAELRERLDGLEARLARLEQSLGISAEDD